LILIQGYSPNLIIKIKIDLRREKKLSIKFRTEKSVSFFDKWIFRSYGDYPFYHILGVATAAGAEVKAEAPRSVITVLFDKS